MSEIRVRISMLMAEEAVKKCCEMHGIKETEKTWMLINKEMLESYSIDMDVKEVKSIKKEKVESVLIEREDKDREKEIKSLILPFESSRVREDLCQGLSHNHNLFTQCQGKREIGEYCKSCNKDVLKKGYPVCGKVSDRLKCGLMDYIDPRGRKVVPYLKVLGNKKDEMLSKIASYGIVISECHLVEEKVEEKKRGRPKKDVKKMETEVEDIFASLSLNEKIKMNEVKEEVKEEIKMNELKEEVKEEVKEEEEEVPEKISVNEFIHKGVKYLKATNTNMVYSIDTHEEIGIYNKMTDVIEEIEYESDDNEIEEDVYLED